MNSLIKLFVNQKLMSFGTASKTLSTNLWTQIYHPKRLPLKQVSRGLTQLSTVALGKKKRKLYDKARRTGDFELWDKFKDPRRKTDRQMRKLHREHVRDIGDSLQSNNTKPFLELCEITWTRCFWCFSYDCYCRQDSIQC